MVVSLAIHFLLWHRVSHSLMKSGPRWDTYVLGETQKRCRVMFKNEQRKTYRRFLFVWNCATDLLYSHQRAPRYLKTSYFFKPVSCFSLVEDSHFLCLGRCANEANIHSGSKTVTLYVHTDLYKALKHVYMFSCSRQLITQEFSEESRASASVYDFFFMNTMLV